jgi:DNA repair protein RadC
MVELLPIERSCRLAGVNDAAAIFAPHLVHALNECLAVAHLGRDQELLSLSVKSDQSIHSVQAPIRSIVAEALACNAASLIIAHNHPSGMPLPSEMDRQVTRLIARTMRPLGLRLQDHLIFAGQNWTSFRGLGLL